MKKTLKYHRAHSGMTWVTHRTLNVTCQNNVMNFNTTPIMDLMDSDVLDVLQAQIDAPSALYNEVVETNAETDCKKSSRLGWFTAAVVATCVVIAGTVLTFQYKQK